MRRAALLIIALLTFYIAGMNRNPSLLMLCLMECVLLILMLWQALYFRRKVSVEFEKQSGSAEKGKDYWCAGTIKNEGCLPAGRLTLRTRMRYAQEKRVRKIYLQDGSGTSTLRFGMNVRYCGLLHLKVDRLRVYDYLSLFSFARPLQQELDIAVYPAERPMHIEFSSLKWRAEGSAAEQTVLRPADFHGEIRQLREYQMGDIVRHIHWNQSARTGQIWIKEYERESVLRVDVFLEISPVQSSSHVEMDAFYELLSALVLGLLQGETLVFVHWYDAESDRLVQAEVGTSLQCRELLLRLYQTDFMTQDMEHIQTLSVEYASSYLYGLRLTSELALYYGPTLLLQFSRERLYQELEKKVLQI